MINSFNIYHLQMLTCSRHWECCVIYFTLHYLFVFGSVRETWRMRARLYLTSPYKQMKQPCCCNAIHNSLIVYGKWQPAVAMQSTTAWLCMVNGSPAVAMQSTTALLCILNGYPAVAMQSTTALLCILNGCPAVAMQSTTAWLCISNGCPAVAMQSITAWLCTVNSR